MPEEAIVPEQGRTYVFVVQDNTVARREVHTGKRRPGDVEIVDGLAEGERVVIEGTQHVREGTKVDEQGSDAELELGTPMLISEVSVRRPVFATVISLLLIIFGLVSLQRLSVREYPDIERPVVSITTNYTGASAAVIETKITQAIEDSIAGIEGILKIESDSADERSQVRIEFDVNRDVDAAANDVRDRIARVIEQAAARRPIRRRS